MHSPLCLKDIGKMKDANLPAAPKIFLSKLRQELVSAVLETPTHTHTISFYVQMILLGAFKPKWLVVNDREL